MRALMFANQATAKGLVAHFTADHCTVSHNVHVAPAGSPCLTASVCSQQAHVEVEGASLIGHHMQGACLEEVSSKVSLSKPHLF